MDAPARETRALGDDETAGRRLADRPRKPQRIAGKGIAAGEETAAPRAGPQKSQSGGRRLGMARQVSPRQPDAETPAGEEQGVEKRPVIETRDRRKGEKSVGGLGAGGRQIGEVDGEEATGEERGGKLGRKMDAGDLTVDRDGKLAGREVRGDVAQE